MLSSALCDPNPANMMSYLLLGIVLLVGQSYAEVTCIYNGKTFQEGEAIPTPDKPCFKCFCREGWTKPDIMHCAQIDCPWNYFQMKGCIPKFVAGKCCPEWDCPENPRDKREVAATVTCNYNGKAYKVGEKIPTPDQPCFRCTCFEGWTKPDRIHCALVECPWGFFLEKGCTPEHVEGQCCPKWNCPKRNKREDVTCSYNGAEYLKGEPIPTPDKPCYKCRCYEGWTGPSATHCAIVDCPFDSNQKLGCKPVYTKGKCCPKWECPSDIASPVKRDITVCEYKGMRYLVGDRIPTPEHPCLRCQCFDGWTEPNGFDCAVVDCPYDPLENPGCKPIYEKDKCCPKWECP